MSFIPCGVAEEHCCGEPSPEDRPVPELLIPGEDTAMPPGLGEVVAGEVEQLGPEEESGYAGYSGVFISVMLCRAARGGVLRRKPLGRDASIGPTANITSLGGPGLERVWGSGPVHLTRSGLQLDQRPLVSGHVGFTEQMWDHRSSSVRVWVWVRVRVQLEPAGRRDAAQQKSSSRKMNRIICSGF
ncbi:hypothetical protein F2P81_026352 [Scophthalmus maximus]|uniref:Uncharacterized protein n=1 Tax=Scophthalmus maximus TaxID=52904 RepID=A0A6A4RM45_SCOMX|nr:hypothetical protein F2P81_026352 [Scophthalmus maximus]